MIERQIFPDIKYGGVIDDYLYHYTQPRYREIEPIRMFTGDHHKHTLSEQTLRRLELLQNIEDRIGEVYQG